MRTIIKIIVWIIVIAVAVLILNHWGFFGGMVLTIIYALWAENTKAKK